MTAPMPHQGTVQSTPPLATGSPPQLDYSRVQAYWTRAQPSLLGPYMMDGFGFPAGAGRFRFHGEQKSIARTIQSLAPSTSVLDLGSGVGVWTEYFAQRFAKVAAVEASPILYEAMKARCSRYQNVTLHNRDVLSFEPTRGLGLVFLGGLLMYLNDHDVRVLLQRLIPCLEPEAIVLCRESTIRRGVKAIQGDYQVVYRSVETYRSILADAGFGVVSVQANTAYINAQMACEFIKKWKTLVPDRFHCLPAVGRFAYWGLRLCYPWNTRLIPWLFARMGYEFPSLTNHFFVLQPSRQTATNRRKQPLHTPLIENERFENAR
ncbi:MAG: methyltransferase domain-containing protein [Planctomycetes bacterium]|nr:methyltransferase domain-containing protein [Planctomycetota bacterium]